MHDVGDHTFYMPHGICLLWKPWLVGLHLGSDLLTAGAYFAIPFAIAAYVRQRRGLAFQPLAWLFVAFIALCGITHVFGAITLWSPVYELEGVIKALTAAVLVATAIMIFPLIPRALALPRTEEFEAANAELATANAEKARMLAELELARSELEARVAARTRELANSRTRELASANARLTSALHASGIMVFEQDADLRYTWVMGSRSGEPISLGRTDAEVHAPDVARELMRIKRSAMAESVSRYEEVELEMNGKSGTWALWVEPRGTAANGDLGVTCVAVDITERRENERRMRAVMGELSHRSKNLLAIVAAIAGQTARSAGDMATFRERFMQRVQSLSAAHDEIVNGDWRGAGFADLVRSQLHVYQESYGDRILASGPDVTLSPHAAQYVALALHELATNAAKHGALAAGGQVELEWKFADQARDSLELVWSERSPLAPIAAANRNGFGFRLLQQLVPRAVDGAASLELSSLGLRYWLRIDARHLSTEPTTRHADALR
jgi:two-component sensor histidine kinase